MQTQVTTLYGLLTCPTSTGAEWTSCGNGSSLLFGNGRFNALLPPFPDVTKFAATSTSLTAWLLFLDTLATTGPAPSNTTKDKR